VPAVLRDVEPFLDVSALAAHALVPAAAQRDLVCFPAAAAAAAVDVPPLAAAAVLQGLHGKAGIAWSSVIKENSSK
jgi:hypothetical protein